MTVRSLAAALLFFLLQPAPQDRPTAVGSIEGTVVRAVSGEPLFHAQLKLNKARTPEEEREAYRDGNDPDANAPTVFTEADGKFLLKDVPPGNYYLNATHNGYAPQTYGQKVLYGPSTIINVQAGQAVKNIAVRMIQGGVLTGHVRTTAGEPVVGLDVSLMRLDYSDSGGKSLWGEDQTLTDDRGEYRFYWIQPARYYVRVARNSEGFYGRKTVLDAEPILPTFYPGVLDPESASVIEVAAGSELGAVDIVVPRPTGYRVRGRIVDSSTGKPPKNASVNISSRKPTAIRVYDNYGGSRSQNYDPVAGTFELRNVLPGPYRISVTAEAGYNDPIAADKLADVRTREDLFEAAFRSGSAGAQVSVDVSASDLNDVVITLTKGITIPVQVSIEGQQFSSIKGSDEIRVNLSPVIEGPGNGYRQSSRPNSDGIAKLDSVQTGEYRIYIDQGTTKDLYVKEIYYGRTDVLNDPLTISDQAPSGLAVVLSPKGGQIEGNLTDALSQPANGQYVVLVPDARDKKRLYKTATTDHNGHFVFRAVPPGGYKLFSWEALERGSYYDPDVISRYETQGRPVRVQESAKEPVDLKMIPPPK